jgi:SAM-dependent methyltransferase
VGGCAERIRYGFRVTATDAAVRAGGTDWAERWRQMVHRREAQTDELQYEAARPGADFWQRRAGQFRRRAGQRQAEGPDRFLRHILEYVDADTTVVDVGAGVGRLAIRLAARARRVVAVEPNAAMVGLLREEVRAAGVANVEVVPTTWEAAEVGRAEVVLSAHVLYPIAEAADFLRKLDASASRAAFIQLHAEQPDVPAIEAWRAIRGGARRPQPGFLEAVNLLAQLGIFAAVEYEPAQRSWRYATFEEAYEDLRDRLVLRPGTSEAAELADFVRSRLRPIEDELAFETVHLHAGTAWWEK